MSGIIQSPTKLSMEEKIERSRKNGILSKDPWRTDREKLQKELEDHPNDPELLKQWDHLVFSEQCLISILEINNFIL